MDRRAQSDDLASELIERALSPSTTCASSFTCVGRIARPCLAIRRRISSRPGCATAPAAPAGPATAPFSRCCSMKPRRVPSSIRAELPRGACRHAGLESVQLCSVRAIKSRRCRVRYRIRSASGGGWRRQRAALGAAAATIAAAVNHSGRAWRAPQLFLPNNCSSSRRARSAALVSGAT